MATWYVSSGSGDDSWNGTSKTFTGGSTGPKKTLTSALAIGMADSDTVEILDESTYYEDNITISIPNLTITHTASHLGRPVIDAEDNIRFWSHGTSGTIFHGIEMRNCTYGIYKGTANAGEFHLTGCFIHDLEGLYSGQIEGSASNKTSINECILQFKDVGGYSVSQHIRIVDNVTFRNCLITSSADIPLITDYDDSGNTVTASYCTLISRGENGDSIIQAGQVRNCIVSGSGHGIASDDHTYNLVLTDGANFKNHADDTITAAATGDLEDQDPLFVNGAAMGPSPSVAANYQLQEASPAVGYATPIGIFFDLTGNVRPGGGDPGSEDNPDMGCFEYQFAPPVPDPWNSYGTQSYPKFGGDFTINRYQNLTSNYRLAAAHNPSEAQSISSGAGEYNISISGNWSGTYSGSELSGSGSYNFSGSGSGSSDFVLSSSGDHSGSYSGSISYGTGSYCISGSGVITLLSGSGQFTGSYCSGAYVTTSGTSGYNLTGTYTCYYFCGSGSYYVSGSSIHTLSGSGTGTGSLATASYYISGATSYNITGASEYYISGTHEEAYFSGTGSMTLSGTGSYNFVSNVPTGNRGQVPFSLGQKGPGTLRSRLGAYCVTKGGDPSTIIRSSSA